MAGNARESGRSVVSKLASILMIFTDGGEHSLAEIARSARLPVSTAHRLTTELTERRLLARGEDGRYRIGLLLRMVCAPDSNRSVLEDRAPRFLEDLAAVTGCRIRLGILARHRVPYMEKLPGSNPVAGFSPEASLSAYSSALGRVLLAFSPLNVVEPSIEGMSRIGWHSPVSPQVVRKSLALTRANRMAVNPGGGASGRCCFAMPVFGPGGEVVAALGLTMRDGKEVQPLAAALRVASSSLSRELAATHWPGVRPSLADTAPDGAEIDDLLARTIG